tara:strand:+ start:1184 stop:1384 length:201 start_codon:yes stop_codon:yes gene_type:complete
MSNYNVSRAGEGVIAGIMALIGLAVIALGFIMGFVSEGNGEILVTTGLVIAFISSLSVIGSALKKQ